MVSGGFIKHSGGDSTVQTLLPCQKGNEKTQCSLMLCLRRGAFAIMQGTPRLRASFPCPAVE